MTNKQQLREKISRSEEQLEILRKKKENLEINILRLEEKLRNQKFQLDHIKVERELSEQAKTDVEGYSSIEDQVLKG